MAKRTDRFKTGSLGLYAPRYWPSWLAVGITWVLAKLPFSVQDALARGLAALVIKTRTSRTKTIYRNIELCFPQLGTEAREALAKANLYSTMLSLFDLVDLVWARSENLLDRCQIIGEEHFHAALASGKPLIMVSGHSNGFITGLAKLSTIKPFSALYRAMDNPILQTQLYERAMAKYPIRALHRKEVTRMLTELNEGGMTAIFPDQDFGSKRSIFIPFFGIDTATITAIPQYAKTANAQVLFAYAYRQPGGRTVLEIEPALENYPTGDDITDTLLWSDWLETKIRAHPEDYFWIHKRFKTRPEGQPKRY